MINNPFRSLRRSKELAEGRSISAREVARAVGASRQSIDQIERRPLSGFVMRFLALLRYYDLRIVDSEGKEYFKFKEEEEDEEV